MPTVNFGGLATGLDTEALIAGLMGAERVPLTRLQTQKSTLESAKTTLSALSTKLAAFKSAAKALETPAGYSSFKATSSDSAIVATASGTTPAGSVDVEVQALARASKHYSAAQASSTAGLGHAGSLTLQVGTGSVIDLTIDAGDSLTAIATKINGAGARVSAAVVYDGTTYRLQVRGLDTGAANGVTVGGAVATGLGLDVPAAQVQAAQDAQLTVDGISFTRSTNQVTGVIPGVTLALTRTTTTPATIQVEGDTQGVKAKIQALVTAYNDVVSAGQKAAGYGSIKASSSELSGDSTIRNILGRLSRTLSEPVPGATGRYQTLGSVGLKSTREGTLTFDEAAFDAASTADPTAVSRLFVTDSALGTTGAMSKLASAVDQLAVNANAPLLTRIESLGVRMTRIDQDVEAQSRRLDLMEEQLRNRFTQLEMLVTKINAQGSALAGISSSNND